MSDQIVAGAIVRTSAGREKRVFLLGLLLALVILLAGDMVSGPASFGLKGFWQALSAPDTLDPTLQAILWRIRIPQALMALAIGAALGLAGAEMQTVLNNPLASPYTLGISSAAALGAALALVLDWRLPWASGPYVLAANAFAFAMLCCVAIDLVARKARLGATGMVLFGIALVFGFNALLSILQFTASAAALQDLVFWMMGSLGRADWTGLAIVGTALLLIVPWSLSSAWRLAALRFGDERATSFGVNPQGVRRAALFRISVLAAVAVALTGVIGFIGLVAPHIARRFWGEDHRWYLPASALIGSALLLAASVAAKWIGSETALPVGLVTTLVGIPFFLFALTRRRVLH